MRRFIRALALLLVGAPGCASNGGTSLTTWQAPGTGRLQFHRVVAAFVSTDQGMRKSMEDRLAARVAGSFPAYSVIPDLSLSDAGVAREQLRNKLFDGAVVMRVVDPRSERKSGSRSDWHAAYPTFLDYWRSSWKLVREPADIAADRTVLVEIAIYSLADNSLVWAGRATTEPRPVKKIMDSSVDAVVGELWAKGMFR